MHGHFRPGLPIAAILHFYAHREIKGIRVWMTVKSFVIRGNYEITGFP